VLEPSPSPDLLVDLLCESLPVCSPGDREPQLDLGVGQALACLAGPIAVGAITVTDACAALVPGAIHVSADVTISVLGTMLSFPVEGQHPLGEQEHISGLNGLSAAAAARNGTVGALAQYQHDDLSAAFGQQWLSLSNLYVEAGFYSEVVTGAWERTTRTTFYLQAEGAASMHCPALGEASTLTAGARLHVGYDSRTALTWSVAPVDWPPMDAFGRLALCVIGDAAGVSAELLRAINGVAGEEASGSVFAPYEKLEWAVGTLEHGLSTALHHPVVAPVRLREGVTGIYLQVYGLTSTDLLHSALNGIDKLDTLEWLAEMLPVDAALTVPHHGSGAASLYTRIRIPRIAIVEPSSRHDGVAIRGVTLESEVTSAGRWSTRMASTLELFDLNVDFTAAWTSEHGPVITVRLYHVTLFTLNFFGQRRLDLYDAAFPSASPLSAPLWRSSPYGVARPSE